MSVVLIGWWWSLSQETVLQLQLLLLWVYTLVVKLCFLRRGQSLWWSPELVDVLLRHQVLDEDEAILLIEESLLGAQQVRLEGVSAKDKVTVSTTEAPCVCRPVCIWKLLWTFGQRGLIDRQCCKKTQNKTTSVPLFISVSYTSVSTPPGNNSTVLVVTWTWKTTVCWCKTVSEVNDNKACLLQEPLPWGNCWGWKMLSLQTKGGPHLSLCGWLLCVKLWAEVGAARWRKNS